MIHNHVIQEYITIVIDTLQVQSLKLTIFNKVGNAGMAISNAWVSQGTQECG